MTATSRECIILYLYMAQRVSLEAVKTSMVCFSERLDALVGEEPERMPPWAGTFWRTQQAHGAGECLLTRYSFEEKLVPWRGVTGARRFAMEYHIARRLCGNGLIIQAQSHESLTVPATTGKYHQSYNTTSQFALNRTGVKPVVVSIAEDTWDQARWKPAGYNTEPLLKVSDIEFDRQLASIEEADALFDRTLHFVQTGLKTWIELDRPLLP